MAFRRSYRRTFRRTTRRPFLRRRGALSYRRRGFKSSAFTDYKGNVTTFGFRGRRIKGPAYRRMLWRDTMAKNHYRSLLSETQVLDTEAGNALGLAYTLLPQMDGIGTTNLAFWETGVVQTDEGVTVPGTWAGDIVQRGGAVKCQIFNPSTVDSIGFKLFVVKTIKNPDLALFPNASQVPRLWDPSTIPDFARKVGKVLMSREGTIRVLSSSSVEYKLRVSKIDQAEFRVAGTPNVLVAGNQIAFVLALYNLSTTTAINTIVNVSSSQSFSADALA